MIRILLMILAAEMVVGMAVASLLGAAVLARLAFGA
jgi:hypothetical protein